MGIWVEFQWPYGTICSREEVCQQHKEAEFQQPWI